MRRYLIGGPWSDKRIAVGRFDYFDGGIWKGREYWMTVTAQTITGVGYGPTRERALYSACVNIRRMEIQTKGKS